MSPRARSIERRRLRRKRAAQDELAGTDAVPIGRPEEPGIGLLPAAEEPPAEAPGAQLEDQVGAAPAARAAVTAEPVAVGAGCPKHMVFGPCGGVQPDGSCEIGGACAFVGDGAAAAPAVEAPAPVSLRPAAEQVRLLMQRRQIIVADLPSAGPDVELERRLASALAGSVDAALLGDSPWARLQLPPSLRASLVAVEGLRPWPGLNCRDRNRVALEAELVALAATGVGAVHCVTGDHPLAGHAARGTQAPEAVFDLDSTQLASLAAARGLVVSVAESPSAPPVRDRPARAAAKARAGASIVYVNHAGNHDELVDFIARTRERSPDLRIVVCVPMVLSDGGARRLAEFLPGASLPASLLAPLDAPNPAAAAIAAAVDRASSCLAIDGVDGVDLSAPPAAGEELVVADALATVGRELDGGRA
ncbi:MAG: hypothetical protein AAGC46_12030 [Solirubrobacteraceae bacterium]|nr:hypothetical protein [Patulibacter sp.]